MKVFIDNHSYIIINIGFICWKILALYHSRRIWKNWILIESLSRPMIKIVLHIVLYNPLKITPGGFVLTKALELTRHFT